MKIYVVESKAHDGGERIGIFDNIEKAKTRLRVKFNELNEYYKLSKRISVKWVDDCEFCEFFDSHKMEIYQIVVT